MTVMKFSRPQLILRNIMDGLLKTKSLYNDRKTIKPYEIDIFYPTFNLAFEYQGKNWHVNRPSDAIKLNIFKERKINIIYIIEESRNYEKDIKNQLINKIGDINKICGTSITNEEILNYFIGDIYLEIYNKKELINISKSYTSFKKFRKENESIYQKLCSMELINEATSHMKNKRRYYNEDSIKETIKKYTNRTDLIKYDKGTYAYILKNNLRHLIIHLSPKYKKSGFTIEEINEKIKRYITRKEFREENMKMYNFLDRVNLLSLISHLKKIKRKESFTIEDIKLKIKNYTTKKEFKKENKKMYNFIYSRKLLYLISHLKSRAK